MRRRFMVKIAIFLCMCGILAGSFKSVTLADNRSTVDTFSGEVGVLKQENNNYVMQVTVENKGEDFSGTVQVVFAGSGRGNCAYNTELALPAQGKKQFTINVTERAVEKVRGMCSLNFLDEKGNVLQAIPLSNVFGNAKTGITTGILSDNYSGLTFMDAGGRDFRIWNLSSPMELVELNSDNLKGYLDGLYFLIIDQFNVESLGEENIQAIQDWVKGGGWLMIGTGAYAEQTLSGFDKDFIDVEIRRISEPGEDNEAQENADRYGYYYQYVDAGIDFTKMSVMELNYNKLDKNLYEDTEQPVVGGGIEDGAVSILLFSLGEQELRKLNNYAIQNIYDNLMYRSDSYQGSSGFSDMERVGRRSLAFIDNSNTNIDFTWLQVLIGGYVVFIGPVLYLILRKVKKSEWYWIFVPVLGVVFIGGVFLFGQGARVNETKVYSVTMQQAGNNQADTYFLAYHSGVKEWDMLLREDYKVAGPGIDGVYRSYATNVEDYYYVISQDKEGMSIGIKPQENFDSGLLYAQGMMQNKGNIFGENIWLSGVRGNTKGSVTNDTICDLAYMAVWSENYLMVFSDVGAGETIDLAQAAKDGRCVYENSFTNSNYDSLLYDMVGIYGRQPGTTYEQDDMAALLIGMGKAAEKKPLDGDYVMVTGVVRDYDKAVVSKCSETSYGCLYSYIKAEGEKDAAN